MTMATLSLDEAIDGQRIRPASVLFLVVATLAMLSDGFDLSAIGYVGPEVVKQWHITPSQLVPVFSAGIVGLLCGAALLGFLGDRFGRKIAILLGLAVLGGFTLLSMAAHDVPQLTALRFLAGVGLGGVIPNIVALVAEMTPKRLRGMAIVIVNFGVPAGIAIPGLAAAALVPRYGWPVLMLLGGVLPLVVAVISAALLPESARYLANRGRDAHVRRLLGAIRPDLPITAATRIVSPPRAPVGNGSPRGLFADGLAALTPLLWLALAANQMANFFSLSWLPTLLQSAGANTTHAGINASLFSIGGLAGGLVLTVIVDRLGALPMALLFALGVPLMWAIGQPGLPPGMLPLIIAGAGFCVTGVNFNMSAVLGMLYPTPVRSLGTGWAQAMGRIGSLAAPLIGGALLGLHLPLSDLLLAPAISLGIGAVAAIGIAALCVRRFGSARLDDALRALPHPPALAAAATTTLAP